MAHIFSRIHRAGLLYGVLMVAAFGAFMWSTRVWPDTPDGLFHLQRVRALAEALRSGVLYPRWFPDFAFGHGYPVFHYYAPAFYYPPAILHLLGLDLILATRIASAALFALSGGAMLLLLRCWTGWAPSLFGVGLYLASPYRLYDFFVRGALPEFAAFLWLPLLVYAGCAVAPADWRLGDLRTGSSPRRTAPFVALALSVTGLVVTHNLTALMAIVAGGTAWAVSLVAALATTGDEAGKRIRLATSGAAGGLGVATGILLSAPYAAPALLDAWWVNIGAGESGAGYANHFATWQSLWEWSVIYPYPAASDTIVPLPGYVLFILVASIVSLPWGGRLRRHILVAVVVTLAALWLMTGGSEIVWRAAMPVMGKLQFPWRWQTISTFTLAVLGALLAEMVMRRVPGRPALRRWAWAAIAAATLYVIVYAVLALPDSRVPYSADELTAEQMWAFDAEHGQVGATWTSEFLPRWVEAPVWAIGRDPDVQEPETSGAPVDFALRVEQEGYLRSAYAIAAASPMTATLPNFYFPAWQVRIDDHTVEAFPHTSLGLLGVTVPAGEHRLSVIWEATASIWLGRIAWAAVWLALAWLFRRWRRGPWRLALPFWIGVGALFVVASGGWAEQGARRIDVAADYGPVQLVGASVSTASPGGTAGVRLTWSVSGEPEAFTAFVHVTDAEGRVVTQNDAPLAGSHLPASRWTPGMIVRHEHRISLPAELSPGAYRLMVGVYRPGQAERPLVAQGQDEPRLEIGVMEIGR